MRTHVILAACAASQGWTCGRGPENGRGARGGRSARSGRRIPKSHLFYRVLHLKNAMFYLPNRTSFIVFSICKMHFSMCQIAPLLLCCPLKRCTFLVAKSHLFYCAAHVKYVLYSYLIAPPLACSPFKLCIF